MRSRATTSRSGQWRALAISGGALVLAAVVWFAGRTGQRASTDEAVPASPEPRLDALERKAMALDPDAGASELRERSPAIDAAVDETGEPGTVLVRGTLVVVDDGGHEHRDADGQFELVVWGKSVSMQHAAELAPAGAGLRERLRRRHATTVQVEDGLWEAVVPRHTARGFENAQLDGQPLCDLAALELEGGDPAVIELSVTGHALYPARLSVVDGRTLRELEGVLVATAEPADPRLHPGDLVPVIADAVSPLEIPAPPVERRIYLVGAAGYAWERVDWSHRAPAFRVVELERSGTIAVDLATDWPLADCALAIDLLDGAIDLSPYTRIGELSSPSQVIPGIAPGTYRVALVPRENLVQAQVASIAETTVTVSAGETARVALRAEVGTRPDVVGLAGVIRMSSSWSPGGPHLVLRALGPSALWHMETGGLLGGVVVDGEGSAWSFRSPAALAGATYLLTERRTGFLHVIEVGPRGAWKCELEIPDPVAVRVEAVDRATAEPVTACELAWLQPTPAGVGRSAASQSLWIHAADRPGAFDVRVPAWDELEFEVQATGYVAARATVRPRGGPSARLRIALDRL